MAKTKTTGRSSGKRTHRSNNNSVELVDMIEETTEAYENAGNTEKEEIAQVLENMLNELKKSKYEVFDLKKIDATKERVIAEAERIIKQQARQLRLLQKGRNSELKNNKELLKVYENINDEIDTKHVKNIDKKCNMMYDSYMSRFSTPEEKKTSKKK